MYWDDNDLIIEPYERIKKIYFCGKELLQFKEQKTLVYKIMVLDYDECCFAEVYTDGEIKVIFQAHSSVPHKHGKGGQSQQRFQRIRDSEITLWFKRINEYLKDIDGEIIAGISPVYRRRFKRYLNTYNKEKIIEWKNTEYSSLCGIHQMISRLEKERA